MPQMLGTIVCKTKQNMGTRRPEKNSESEVRRTSTELSRTASRIVPPKSDAEIAYKKIRN
jgi:hypothetical protein